MTTPAPMKDIIEKVKKLYKLAEGTSFADEASAAVEKAQELLKKHNLTITPADLKDKYSSACAELIIKPEYGVRAKWPQRLLIDIQEAFSVKVLTSCFYEESGTRKNGDTIYKQRPTVSFIGVEPDVSIARHTFEYLCGVAIRENLSGYTASEKTHWRNGFAEAVGIRLVKKHKEESADTNSTDLVVQKEALIKAHLEATHPLIKTKTIPPPDYYGHGYGNGLLAGKNVPLSDALYGPGCGFHDGAPMIDSKFPKKTEGS